MNLICLYHIINFRCINCLSVNENRFKQSKFYKKIDYSPFIQSKILVDQLIKFFQDLQQVNQRMDDDQLQMLQRELMSVQQQKTNPLAERTVAQIMVKLHHSGFRFFSTTDGNEYVTPQRLDQEILDLILERGHVNIGILPQILNIGLDTIEGRVIRILTKHSSQSTNVNSGATNRSGHAKIFRHNNLLLSEKYLMSILEQIRQTLLIEGKVNLQSIALDNEFNMKFTEKLIKENIQILNAELHHNQLITREFNLMRKLQLLGYLRAISNPISFQTLLKNSKLAENDQSKTLEKLLNQIIEEKKVKGKYQNSYYVPESFILNQKQRILQFFSSNGYIEFEMLQKQFLVSKPEQWLQKNLSETKEFANKFVIFEQVCILTEKLNFYAHNITEQLNHEGFIEISQVLPFSLEEKQLERFMNDYCKLKDYFLFEGYCYSEKWLQKVMEEFREKVFKSIFLNVQQNAGKNDPKNTKKKGGKKDAKSSKLIEEDQLIEKLYNQGLAEYSVAQNIAPALIPILTKKLEQQKKKYEKQLAQNRGILNSSFLKYRSCNSIMRNVDGLQRNLNIIEKQKKKSNQAWVDKDFGPNENDEKGIFSVIYYDNILPKGWPSLDETLKWESITVKVDHELQSGLTSQNCLFGDVLSTIQTFNQHYSNNTRIIESPFQLPKDVQKSNSNSESPFAFGFYRSQKDRRYVIVDDKLPFVGEKLLGLSGIYGLAQKAYAKFRYCYKGILNLSFKTLLLQITGLLAVQHTLDKNNHKDVISQITSALKQSKLIICMAEGEAGKTLSFEQQGQQTNQKVDISFMKPYLCFKVGLSQSGGKHVISVVKSERPQGQETKYNQGFNLTSDEFVKVFKNVYVL